MHRYAVNCIGVPVTPRALHNNVEMQGAVHLGHADRGSSSWRPSEGSATSSPTSSSPTGAATASDEPVSPLSQQSRRPPRTPRCIPRLPELLVELEMMRHEKEKSRPTTPHEIISEKINEARTSLSKAKKEFFRPRMVG
eukprot:gnl/TRDRNA2_/TRDRNA2_195574_c0_seq1.p1 gnl/TRDRNA2_/TRDRNA2_195574_c0~~gnl/TRDRNA2_/TRDRNA2_195574_c0_seq1.p1  ORF type:complete len:139 (-),score=24.25 gnl/TRDRNA2_/TRDRNA2_195574_c0_seq1:178-594(-)